MFNQLIIKCCSCEVELGFTDADYCLPVECLQCIARHKPGLKARQGAHKMKTPQHVIDWCNDHKLCKGCQFAGNECVAPEADRNFDEWLVKMSGLILRENRRD